MGKSFKTSVCERQYYIQEERLNMLKTFLSIIVEVSNKIYKPNTTPDEHNVSIKEEEDEGEYDGGLGKPYSQRKWAENYYRK
jgi:hypothetical protein